MRRITVVIDSFRVLRGVSGEEVTNGHTQYIVTLATNPRFVHERLRERGTARRLLLHPFEEGRVGEGEPDGEIILSPFPVGRSGM